jgi:hypothetical protein
MMHNQASAFLLLAALLDYHRRIGAPDDRKSSPAQPQSIRYAALPSLPHYLRCLPD